MYQNGSIEDSNINNNSSDYGGGIYSLRLVQP